MTEEERKVVVIGHDTGFASATLLATLASGGLSIPTVIRLDEDRLMDRLDILEMFLPPDDRPRDRMGFRHPHPPKRDGRAAVVDAMFNGLRGKVEHIDTPKPIGKRKARRMRGKGKRA